MLIKSFSVMGIPDTKRIVEVIVKGPTMEIHPQGSERAKTKRPHHMETSPK